LDVVVQQCPGRFANCKVRRDAALHAISWVKICCGVAGVVVDAVERRDVVVPVFVNAVLQKLHRHAVAVRNNRLLVARRVIRCVVNAGYRGNGLTNSPAHVKDNVLVAVCWVGWAEAGVARARDGRVAAVLPRDVLRAGVAAGVK
jgi:hypothetical protein